MYMLVQFVFVHLQKKNESTAKAECTAAAQEKTRAKQSCIHKTKTLKNRNTTSALNILLSRKKSEWKNAQSHSSLC